MPSPPAPTSKASWGMVTAFLLAVVSLFLGLAGSLDDTLYVRVAPSILLTILGILFAIQRDADQRRIDHHDKHQTIIETIHVTKATASTLHEAFKLQEHETILLRIAEILVQAQRSHSFFSGLVRRRLSDLCGNLRPTAQGDYTCELEEEARLTNDVLGVCTKGIRAVSYQDERWWSSANGKAFVKLQKEARRRGLSIVRIFIVRKRTDFTDADWSAECLSEDDLNNVNALLADADLHNATYKIELAAVPKEYRRDFVVYDDVVVKSAESISGRTEKRARFTINPSLVEQAIADFETLRALSAKVLDTR